jgi:purine-binding chemotaxis protein CheW
MSDQAATAEAIAPDPRLESWVAFSLSGKRYALPMAAVEAVATPPAVALVPHAVPALLGIGNFAGQIVPILDLGCLLESRREKAAYDGSGVILRLRSPEGTVGLWVDDVERLINADPETLADEQVALLDPADFLNAAFDAPPVGAGGHGPLGDVADLVAAAPATAATERFIAVEVGGRQLPLPRDAVVEVMEAVPWTRVPRAPAGFMGVAMLRGAALPVLSIAALLGLPDHRPIGGFAAVELFGHCTLLAVDRIVGLRSRDGGDEAAIGERPPVETEPLDIARMIPEEVRRIVLDFATAATEAAPADAGEAVEYLAFAVDEEDFAVPVACVDRVVGEQPIIALPQSVDPAVPLPTRIIGVVELSGQILPVATLRSPDGVAADHAPVNGRRPGAYVILRGREGLGAIAVDRIDRVVKLHLAEATPPPATEGIGAAVTPPGFGKSLRIIAPERLWGVG